MEQLIGTVLKWLKEMGFSAGRQMPGGTFLPLEKAVVAVGIGKAQAQDAGLYSYLGLTELGGKSVSLYGRRLEAEILMEVLSPASLGAKGCMQEADALLTKLAGSIAGITLGKISVEGCRFLADEDCFGCKVTVQAQAYLYALSNEEETEFTDFMLKGEVQ